MKILEYIKNFLNYKSILLKVGTGILAIAALPSFSSDAIACTSAIIGPEASASGRPLLWKHRDTNTADNKVEYIPGDADGGYAYVALFNAKDARLKEAWTGMNEVGFAIMNTASYNIKDDNVPSKNMDKEGFVMALALKTCKTVDDFEELLRTLPRPMGVETNFGAIDALGNGAYFETNNHSFVKFDVKDAPGYVLIRTNYSHSGRPNQGYGYVREANAEVLLAEAIKKGNVTAEFLTEKVSRSFYHDVHKKDALEFGERWAIDEDFIPRYKSTATIVIEGIKPLDNIEDATPKTIVPQYIMWTGLGYPPVTDIFPVWCHKKGVEEGLRGVAAGGTSPIGNESKKRRGEVFPPRKGGNKKYIDLNVLSNKEGTGYLQILPPRNHETYEKISRKRDAGEISFDK